MKTILPPLLMLVALLVLWHASVEIFAIKPFVLPAPLSVAEALMVEGPSLLIGAANTLKVALIAVFFALMSGILLVFLYSLSPFIERALSPVTVVMQVTPIVSVAPLILIWTGIDGVNTALVIIAWLAAFFPVLTNLRSGLREVDPQLAQVFDLYNASNWQRFRHLIFPSLLPFLLAGLRISAALALVGTVVAEFVAGSGGSTGLAWRILEAGNRLQVDKMFAGLILLSAIGLVLYYGLAALDRYVLRHR